MFNFKYLIYSLMVTPPVIRGNLMKCVVLAAGFGSRMQPFSSFRPKFMLPVAGKPIIQYGIEQIRDQLGVTEFVFVVGYLRNTHILNGQTTLNWTTFGKILKKYQTKSFGKRDWKRNEDYSYSFEKLAVKSI